MEIVRRYQNLVTEQLVINTIEDNFNIELNNNQRKIITDAEKGRATLRVLPRQSGKTHALILHMLYTMFYNPSNEQMVFFYVVPKRPVTTYIEETIQELCDGISNWHISEHYQEGINMNIHGHRIIILTSGIAQLRGAINTTSNIDNYLYLDELLPTEWEEGMSYMSMFKKIVCSLTPKESEQKQEYMMSMEALSQ